MTKHSTDNMATAAEAKKAWQAPTLTVLPAEDAENSPIAVQGDGPISMGS